MMKEASQHCCCISHKRLFSSSSSCLSDSRDSVWRCGSTDPCCAPSRGEGGRCWAGGLCPASPHIPTPRCRAGPECCASALWYPCYRQAAGAATLLACSKGEEATGLLSNMPQSVWRKGKKERKKYFIGQKARKALRDMHCHAPHHKNTSVIMLHSQNTSATAVTTGMLCPSIDKLTDS